jgi:hypothetical protein
MFAHLEHARSNWFHNTQMAIDRPVNPTIQTYPRHPVFQAIEPGSKFCCAFDQVHIAYCNRADTGIKVFGLQESRRFNPSRPQIQKRLCRQSHDFVIFHQSSIVVLKADKQWTEIQT